MKKYKKFFIGIAITLLICVLILFFNIDYNFAAAWGNKIEHNILCDIAIITAGLIVSAAILSGAVYFIRQFIMVKFLKKPAEESSFTFDNDYTSNLAMTNAVIKNIKDDMGPNK